MENKDKNLVKVTIFILIITVAIILSLPLTYYYMNNSRIEAHDKKVSMIESKAIEYGNKHRDLIIKGISTFNDNPSTITINSYGENNSINTFTYNTNKKYKADEKLSLNEYRATKIKVKDLAQDEYLTYDKTDTCMDCTSDNKEYFNNVIINPINNNVINECYVYIYYKDNEVKAYFDKKTCDNTSDKPTLEGREYKYKK